MPSSRKPELAVEQVAELSVIGDEVTLMWYHLCNIYAESGMQLRKIYITFLIMSLQWNKLCDFVFGSQLARYMHTKNAVINQMLMSVFIIGIYCHQDVIITYFFVTRSILGDCKYMLKICLSGYNPSMLLLFSVIKCNIIVGYTNIHHGNHLINHFRMTRLLCEIFVIYEASVSNVTAAVYKEQHICLLISFSVN